MRKICHELDEAVSGGPFRMLFSERIDDGAKVSGASHRRRPRYPLFPRTSRDDQGIECTSHGSQRLFRASERAGR